jgi:pyruvate dehydrogenase E2 component (dihydrolipoamide acetyltransferase)
MRVDVVVPQIGEAVSELTLVQWLKHPGDAVKTGDILFEIDSDKAIVEVEAFTEGVLAEVVHGDGSAVLPLQVVAVIETDPMTVSAPQAAPAPAVVTSPVNAPASEPKASPVAERMAADLKIDLRQVQGSGTGGRITADDVRRHADAPAPAANGSRAPAVGKRIVSPKARLLAREAGVLLEGITGSGPDGLIIVRDVRAAQQAHTAQTAASAVQPAGEPLSRTRQIIARRMTDSKQQVPHFYLMADVSMTRAGELRRHCVDALGWPKAPTYTDILIRACALALKAVPQVNQSFAGDMLVPNPDGHIGVAVSTDSGLVVPVIQRPAALSLRGVSDALKDAASRARDGRLRPSDMGAKSMTISNLGMYAVDAFVAIIDMPDPMILAVGRVADRVVPVNGVPAVQPMCTLTLSVDHRVLDGAAAAQFLGQVIMRLEQPFTILGDAQ